MQEPPSTADDKRLAWIVAAAAFVLLAPGAFFGMPDCKTVVGATRILDGDVPYRDFWTMYAPGAFYAIAGLFALFGRELLVQGLAAALVWACASAAFFLLLRRIGAGRRLALGLAAVLALMRWGTALELTSYQPAFLMALLAIHEVLSARLFRAGLWLGLAAVFKHDVAAYAAIGSAVPLLLARRSPAKVVAGALAALLPAAALVAWSAGADAWRDLLVFPATDFPGVRAEPYPGLLPNLAMLQAWVDEPASLGRLRGAVLALTRWIQCCLPQVFFLGGALAWIRLRGRMPLAGAIAVASIPLFWLSAHVQQNTNLHSMAVLSMVLYALGRGRVRGLSVVGVAYALGLLVPPAIQAAWVLRELPASRTLGIPGAALVRVPESEREMYAPVVAWVRERVPPGEPIYVGLVRHDATVVSNQAFYFLCDRPPCARWNELHPGITDREDVQRAIAASIDAASIETASIRTGGVRCLVLWRFGWSKERLDAIRDRNRAAVPGAGSDWLDRWIAERFEVAAELGQHRILWRRAATSAPSRAREPGDSR